jgi:hypothetical protein
VDHPPGSAEQNDQGDEGERFLFGGGRHEAKMPDPPSDPSSDECGPDDFSAKG